MSRRPTKGIVGRQFGMLTVLRHVSATPAESFHYVCRCECGAEAKVRDSSHLIDGKRSSCGCAARSRKIFHVTSMIDVTGMRFGILTAKKHAPTVASRQGAHWLFKCDCGTSVLARLKDVRHGNTASCGCMKPYRGKDAKLLDLNRPWRKADHVDDRWLVLVGMRSPPHNPASSGQTG